MWVVQAFLLTMWSTYNHCTITVNSFLIVRVCYGKRGQLHQGIRELKIELERIVHNARRKGTAKYVIPERNVTIPLILTRNYELVMIMFMAIYVEYNQMHGQALYISQRCSYHTHRVISTPHVHLWA
jgi:hypothetical protein